MIGYNLELGITKELEVSSREDGEILLNARLFGEIINRMPAGELTLSTDDKLLTIIKGGGAQFTILGMSAEEYPEIPVISEEKSFRIPADTLRSMISQTLFAVSQDAATPVLTGTLFELKGGTLYLVSVDGCRLALRKETVNCSESFKFVAPGKTLSELLKLIGKFSRRRGQRGVGKARQQAPGFLSGGRRYRCCLGCWRGSLSLQYGDPIRKRRQGLFFPPGNLSKASTVLPSLSARK